MLVKPVLIDERKEIDISLKRLLTARFELGEMDEQPAWAEIPTSVLNSKEHQALALRMARESLVLLQNKNNILPLNTHLKVAVMGPNANDSVMQWGNYNGIRHIRLPYWKLSVPNYRKDKSYIRTGL